MMSLILLIIPNLIILHTTGLELTTLRLQASQSTVYSAIGFSNSNEAPPYDSSLSPLSPGSTYSAFPKTENQKYLFYSTKSKIIYLFKIVSPRIVESYLMELEKTESQDVKNLQRQQIVFSPKNSKKITHKLKKFSL